MTATDFSVSGQRVLVVGAARSGVAAAQLLASRGAVVTLTDAKQQIPQEAELRSAGIRLELGRHDTRTFTSSNLIVMSPGVPLEMREVVLARAAGVPVIGELELASRWLRGPIVAITGTKGKSTTTTLVGRMLEAAGRRVLVGGNIGLPVSAQVDASTADTVHVIEASSFQLETTDRFRPWIAALLNFSPDHLDRHPDQAAYAAAKMRIFANQRADDWAVVNADSTEAVAMTSKVRGRLVTYSVEDVAADVHVGRGFVWHRTSEGAIPLLPVAAVHLHGRHMLSNVVAATTISHLAGAGGASLAQALAGFHGLEHVMELVATKGSVRFINDSKATNIDAAAKSIESFDKVVAIIGGKYKGGEFTDLAAPLRAHGRAVVAIGEARPLVRQALIDVVPVVDADTLADAVRQAWDLAAPDGVVLLAPACSSFDMFADYADRGRQFKKEVQKLISEA
ncbi:MAG TPA: UDP-N-acetylmuramoyl-L-alanine--D-glutamate ligase [Vicinamibacterales bacterium]|nr:UDP-N-acetylmuramoyl-L-alanine--D-glutamate ligase [Vicinamibacterales bacterium]